MEIYIINIRGISPNDIPQENLSPSAQQKFNTLHAITPQKAVQSSVADLIIAFIAKKIGISFDSVCVTESGKPYFNGNPLHFSVAHSRNVVAVATNDLPVGIDIEMLKPYKSRLTAYVLNPLEQNEYDSLPTDAQKVKHFYRCFTEKESYAKMSGKGITGRPCNILRYDGAKFLTKYVFQSGDVYCLTVCSKEIDSIHVVPLTFDSII